jgi:hypothetical protein
MTPAPDRTGSTCRLSRSQSEVAPMRQRHVAGNNRVMSSVPIVDLAERHSSDLDVVLLWGRRSGRLWVTVTHRRSGGTARINATPANALDVFRHPFAYGRDRP